MKITGSDDYLRLLQPLSVRSVGEFLIVMLMSTILIRSQALFVGGIARTSQAGTTNPDIRRETPYRHITHTSGELVLLANGKSTVGRTRPALKTIWSG